MIADEIINIIAKETSKKASDITLDSVLLELNMDSLDVMNVVFAIEEKFDMAIPTELARRLLTGNPKTIRQLVEEIQNLTQRPEHCERNRELN
jgi:nodulation protein E